MWCAFVMEDVVLSILGKICVSLTILPVRVASGGPVALKTLPRTQSELPFPWVISTPQAGICPWTPAIHLTCLMEDAEGGVQKVAYCTMGGNVLIDPLAFASGHTSH